MTTTLAPPARNAWIVLFCAAAIVTIALGIRQSSGLFLRPMEFDVGIGGEAFGLAVAIQNLILGVAQPFVGAVADRYGAGRIAALGGLIYAAGLASTAMITDAVGLTLSFGVLVGFAMTGVTFVVAIGAAVRAVPPEKRGLATGIVTAGGSFGQFLLVPVAQGLIDGFGWRAAMLIYAGLAVLIVPLAIGIAGRPGQSGATQTPAQGAGAALREALGHSGFWLLTVGFFVCGIHVAFIGTNLLAFLSDKGPNPAVGAMALALVGPGPDGVGQSRGNPAVEFRTPGRQRIVHHMRDRVHGMSQRLHPRHGARRDIQLRIWEDRRPTVVFVTHDIDEAIFLSDRVLIMSASPGRVIADVAIDLPRPRTGSMAMSADFRALKQRCHEPVRRESMQAFEHPLKT